MDRFLTEGSPNNSAEVSTSQGEVHLIQAVVLMQGKGQGKAKFTQNNTVSSLNVFCQYSILRRHKTSTEHLVTSDYSRKQKASVVFGTLKTHRCSALSRVSTRR